MELSIEQKCKSNEAFLKEKNIVDWYSFLKWSKDKDEDSDDYREALDNISYFYQCKKIKEANIKKTLKEIISDADIETAINQMKDKHLYN